jgi:hypothetical protein
MSQVPSTTPYDPAHPPRCSVCREKLAPCPIFDSGFPERVRYSGFYSCPNHPGGLIYPAAAAYGSAAVRGGRESAAEVDHEVHR